MSRHATHGAREAPRRLWISSAIPKATKGEVKVVYAPPAWPLGSAVRLILPADAMPKEARADPRKVELSEGFSRRFHGFGPSLHADWSLTGAVAFYWAS